MDDPAFERARRAMAAARENGAAALEIALLGIAVGFDEKAVLDDMERRLERYEQHKWRADNDL